MNRSGQKSPSTSSRYLVNRSAHCDHDRLVALARRLGRPVLGVAMVQVQVPELGVRHERAVDEERRADPRAERHEDDDAGLACPRAEAHLGDARGVGVVDHGDVATRGVGEQPDGIVPIHELSMLDAVFTTPWTTTDGSVMPSGATSTDVVEQRP